METVPIIFYWGGNIIRDPDEDVSYDAEPKWIYGVQLGTTLSNLEEMFMSKVASYGESVRLNFKCRYPYRQWQALSKYKILPINDDEALNTFADNDMYGPEVALEDDENELCDEENLLGGSDDDDDKEDNVDAPIDLEKAPIPPRPDIPFYENIHMGGDFDMSSRDVVPRNRIWNAKNPELDKVMIFVDKKQLVHAVKLYHATNNREYKHDCRWWLRASLSRKHGLFEIKQYRGPHHWTTLILALVTLASYLLGQVANEPGMLIKNVIGDIKKTMNYGISYKKAWHARAKAIRMLPKFMHALQTSNPGTIVQWKHRYTRGTTIMPVFHFVFWSFKARHRWLQIL
ncbi:hypothetical protein HYC85_029100 [Camellia sinensis]|uniref:Transposase MuDR plant domain-containing protein n=1 Tax=Camellia sinensis TaxID=4442 RepID=A0A7J7FXA3_CAMSI|nr:hypothetical protein HYC85_029100 [Camellia sinensis]